MTSSEENMKASIQSTFAPHMKEIQRRADIQRQGYQDNKTFKKVDDSSTYDFQSPDQKFVAFSLSQEAFAPVPTDSKNPAVCIYGAFSTYDEALEYVKNTVMQHHPNISIFIDETHKWIAAVKSAERMIDPQYIQAHTKRLLNNHQEMLNLNMKEFQENCEKKITGNSKDKKKDTTLNENKNSKSGKSHRINANLDVRGQKVAAVSFIKDDNDIPEFLLNVFGFFENEDSANAYIRNVCGDNVQDFDIDVISTCEWCFPQQMTHENANREVFRSEELDKIMQNHKNQPKQVAKLEESIFEEN